jgi:NAD(P)-dependent dehydrogenase (short-subunit alcohol dehydrogenase family)
MGRTMMEIFRLDGQTALITGGSRGIGLGIAQALAEAGADIVLAARDAATLEQARRGLATTGRNIRVTAFDMRRVEDIPAFYERIAAETGGIDLLVNNAGGIVRGAAETISPQDLQSITVAKRTPLGRWGTPEDIGAAAVFLAAPASDYITGQTLYVDGGLISSMGGFE